MERKSLDEIYEEVDRETELECYDREDIRLKDNQEPYAIVGKSLSGNIILKVGDELGYDVTKSLTFPEAIKLIKDLTNAIINRYVK